MLNNRVNIKMFNKINENKQITEKKNTNLLLIRIMITMVCSALSRMLQISFRFVAHRPIDSIEPSRSVLLPCSRYILRTLLTCTCAVLRQSIISI